MVSRKMKKLCLPVLCCMALALMFFHAPAKCYGFDIEIDVSPNVLNIQSQSTIVTVHTDIAYNLRILDLLKRHLSSKYFNMSKYFIGL